MKFRVLTLTPVLVTFMGCSTGLIPIPEVWKSPPSARTFTHADLRRTVMDTSPIVRSVPSGGDAAEVGVVTDGEGARLYRGSVPLTPPYRQIESFDVSLDRREI